MSVHASHKFPARKAAAIRGKQQRNMSHVLKQKKGLFANRDNNHDIFDSSGQTNLSLMLRWTLYRINKRVKLSSLDSLLFKRRKKEKAIDTKKNQKNQKQNLSRAKFRKPRQQQDRQWHRWHRSWPCCGQHRW
jgi:hypothetical protein